ncbi:MAG: DMT family transporter [Ignavibacteriales bacterium]
MSQFRQAGAARFHTTGMVLAIVSASGFGTLPVLYRYAFSLGATTTGVLAWRFCLASVSMVIYCRILGLSLRVDRVTLAQVALLGGGAYGGLSLLYSTSFRFIPAWLGTMLFYVYPVATAFIARPVLGERLDRAKFHAMALSLAGCLLIVGTPAIGGGLPINVRGAVMALASGVFYAAYSVVARKITANLQPAVLSTHVTIWSAVFYVASAIVSGDRWAPADARSWAVVLSLALVSTAIPMFALMGALSRIGATRTAILGTFEPLVSAALALAFLGERFGWLQAAGAAAVLGSVLVVRRGMAPEAREG